MYEGVYMPGHACRDQGTTVWSLHMPGHTSSGQRISIKGSSLFAPSGFILGVRLKSEGSKHLYLLKRAMGPHGTLVML